MSDTQACSQCLSEVGHEPRVSVRDKLGRESEPLVDMFEIQLSNSHPGNTSGAGQEDGASGASMVNNSEDCIMASNQGQTSDEVHTNLLKGKCLRFRGDVVKRGLPWMSQGFVLLTDGASFDIICDPFFHSRPLDVFTCLSKGLVSSQVSGRGVVMMNGHQGAFFKKGEVVLDLVDFKFLPGD